MRLACITCTPHHKLTIMVVPVEASAIPREKSGSPPMLQSKSPKLTYTGQVDSNNIFNNVKNSMLNTKVSFNESAHLALSTNTALL